MLLKFMSTLALKSLESLKEHEGREIAVTSWLTMTQERIRKFAEATDDLQWIHLDAERARRESPFGATIAHGFLTLSLLPYFLSEAIQPPAEVRHVINYGLNRVRFPAPVRAGARLRARLRLESCRDLHDSVDAIFAVTIEAEGGEKPCCVAEWIVRYFR